MEDALCEGERLALSDTRHTLPVALAVLDSEGEKDGEPVPVGETDALRVCDPQGEEDAERLGETDADTVIVTEDEPVLVRHKEAVPEGERVRDKVTQGEGVWEAQGVAERLGVSVPDREALADTLDVADGDGDGEREPATRSDAETDGVLVEDVERDELVEALALLDTLTLPESVCDAETLRDDVPLFVEVCDGVWDTDTEAHPLAVADTVLDAEGEELVDGEGVPRGDTVAELLKEGDADTVAVPDWLRLTNGLRDAIALVVEVADTEVELETDCEREADAMWEPVAVSQGEGEVRGVALWDWETLPEAEREGDPVVLCEADAVVDALAVPHAEGVTLAHTEGVDDTEGDLNAVGVIRGIEGV